MPFANSKKSTMDIFYPKQKERYTEFLLSASSFRITTEESNNINNMSFQAIKQCHMECAK